MGRKIHLWAFRKALVTLVDFCVKPELVGRPRGVLAFRKKLKSLLLPTSYKFTQPSKGTSYSRGPTFCQSTASSKQLQIPLPSTPPVTRSGLGRGQGTFKNGRAALFEIAKLLSFMLSGSPPVPWIYLTHMMQLCGRDREGLCIPPLGWYEFVSKSVPYDPPHMLGVWPIHL